MGLWVCVECTVPNSLAVCLALFRSLSDGGKTLTFFNHDYKGDFQTVTFDEPDIKKMFYGSFHKVSSLVLHHPWPLV